MSENKDKIQNYIRWTRFNNGHISELQDSFIIIDFFNDLLCDKDIIQDDRQVDHQSLIRQLFKKYYIRKLVFDYYNISRVYVVDSYHRYKRLSKEDKQQTHRTEQQKEERSRFFKFIQTYTLQFLGIIQAVEGKESIVISMLEADEQQAYMYRLLSQTKRYKQIYILSHDGDNFFYQLSWIPLLNLNPDNKNMAFGRVDYYNIPKFRQLSQANPSQHRITRQCRNLLIIFEDRYKLALLKALTGTKSLRRHKGVTIEKLIPLILPLKFQENNIPLLLNNIKKVLQAQIFKTVTNKYFQGEVQQEVMHWLCSAVWNPFDNHKDYLNRDLAYSYMQHYKYSEDVFQFYYSGWFILNQLKTTPFSIPYQYITDLQEISTILQYNNNRLTAQNQMSQSQQQFESQYLQVVTQSSKMKPSL